MELADVVFLDASRRQSRTRAQEGLCSMHSSGSIGMSVQSTGRRGREVLTGWLNAVFSGSQGYVWSIVS